MQQVEIQGRYRDVNTALHVDNVEVLRVVDEARYHFLGVERGDSDLAGILFPAAPAGIVTLVAGHRIEYRTEFTPGRAPYRLRMWVGHIGTTSFTVEAELRGPVTSDDAPPDAIAESTVVMWEPAANAAWTINDEIRAALAEHLDEPVPLRPRRR